MTNPSAPLEALGALAEPLRRRVYQYVLTQEEPVGRDQAATALGVARSVAAFHLDKLVDAGLLEVEYRRPPGRGGPGAGRPAKWYKATAHEVALSVPERHYEVAASLLARSLAVARPSDPTRHALAEAARDYGHALAAASALSSVASPADRLQEVATVLADQGYEPRVAGRELTLENCPFRAIAQLTPELTCAMNLDVVIGLLEEIGDPALIARLDPAPGRCCVKVEVRS